MRLGRCKAWVRLDWATLMIPRGRLRQVKGLVSSSPVLRLFSSSVRDSSSSRLALSAPLVSLSLVLSLQWPHAKEKSPSPEADSIGKRRLGEQTQDTLNANANANQK